jgi:Tfp pilus assembly protein PilN
MASPNELSFLPDDYMERKLQRRTNVICAMLFFIVMLTIGSAFTITERSVRQVEKEHEQIEQEYTEAAKRIQLVQQLQDKQRRMAQQADLAASLLEKVPRSHMLAEITNGLPVGVSLLDFIMESKLRAQPQAPVKSAFEAKKAETDAKKKNAPPPPQIKAYDVTMKITGVATTDVQVAQFISRLNQSPLLKDVNLVISDEYRQADESHLRRFQLEASLDPKAEIKPTMEKPRTAAVEIKETQP